MASRPLWFSPPAAVDLPIWGRCKSESSAGSCPSEDDDNQSIPTARGTPVAAVRTAPPSTPPPPARSPLARATRRGVHHHSAAAAQSAAAQLDALQKRAAQLESLVAWKPALEVEKQALTDALQEERRYRREVEMTLAKTLAGADASMVAASERLIQAKKSAGRPKQLQKRAAEPEGSAFSSDMEYLHATLLEALPMSALMGDVDGPWTCKYKQISANPSVPELAQHLAGAALASHAELSAVEQREESANRDFEQRSMEYADLESQSLFVHNLVEEKRNVTQHLISNCSKLEETLAGLRDASKNVAKEAGAVTRPDKAGKISSQSNKATLGRAPRRISSPSRYMSSRSTDSEQHSPLPAFHDPKATPAVGRRNSVPDSSAHTQKTSMATAPIAGFKKRFQSAPFPESKNRSESFDGSHSDSPAMSAAVHAVTAAAYLNRPRRASAPTAPPSNSLQSAAAPTPPKGETVVPTSDSDAGSSAAPTPFQPNSPAKPSNGSAAASSIHRLGIASEKPAATGEAAKKDEQLANPRRTVLSNCSLLKVNVQVNQADTDHWARVYAAVAITCREFMPQVGYLAELHRQQCERRQEELDLYSRLRHVHNPFSVYLAHRRFMAESRLQCLQLVRQRLAGAALIEMQRVQDSLQAHWTISEEDAKHASPLTRLLSFGVSHQGGARALCSVAACLCALDFYARAELAEVPPPMAKAPGAHAVHSERLSPHAFTAAEDGRLGRKPPKRLTDAERPRTGGATEIDAPKPKPVKRVTIVAPGEAAEKPSGT